MMKRSDQKNEFSRNGASFAKLSGRPVKLFLMFVVAACSAPAWSETVIDLNFMPKSSGYESAFGAGAYQVNGKGVGFYINALSSSGEREPYYENLGVNSFDDPVVKRYKTVTLGNVGATWSPVGSFSLYGGVGYGAATGYAEKYDPTYILGEGGTYYVKDSREDKSGVNFNAGVLAFVGHLAFNLGYNSFPRAAYLGVGAKF